MAARRHTAHLVNRMVYEHARAQITGSDVEIRRAIVGAGEAARRLLAISGGAAKRMGPATVSTVRSLFQFRYEPGAI